MTTVFKCLFPDGKIFVGKTKMPFQKFIKYTVARAKNNPTTIFLWALKKSEKVSWQEVGSYWSTKEANDVYWKLIKSLKTFDREYGYNYITKNGSKWGDKESAMEKSSLSRIKTRLKKMSSHIKNKKLILRTEALIRDIEIYLNKIKDSKQ